MNRRSLRRPRWGAVPVVLVLAAACTDNPVAPGLIPEPESFPAMECRVNVPAQTMSCSLPEDVLAGSAVRFNRTLGGQDKYVKLTNFNNTFADDTFQTYVTVQNLLAAPLGTNGVTSEGVKVFFFEDPSSGVTVANPTAYAFFTSANQPYFLYNQVLTTYEVSDPLPWRFAVPSGVTTFSFKVYVNAPQADESGNGLEAVWNGGTSSDWFASGNWSPGTVPGASTVVQIPGSGVNYMPVLTANASAEALRVASGAMMELAGFNVAVGGNVDAVGDISNGSVTMSGTGSLLKGSIPRLFVTGSTRLQGATVASGAVSVTGSLTVADSAMSISIP